MVARETLQFAPVAMGMDTVSLPRSPRSVRPLSTWSEATASISSAATLPY